MGHLEYTLVDESGAIKHYGQTDNFVTTVGDRCIAESVFERGSSDTTAVAACANANFDVIAISNATVTIDDALDMSDDSTTIGTGDNGILATVKGAATIANDNVGAGSVTATITNSAHPFTFTDSTNATNTLKAAYLVDAECALDDSSLGTLCDGALPAGEILAGQTLSDLAISDGDSLTITWTVTIGASGS
ncbi:hypothetical protein SCCGRSA3_00119 [Marine Group I thaumarchaeote SCGC RSA3]|uniref:Uncharacterized protein n=3 Tax=Marine Group I TaxID=905826 RepID=A0A081RQB6_9ARCH|nr:hypothetical protein AAA799N04_00066 [Marine Group I thaumarchaeote SCGC AAA799-N04]KFM14466.1 hypothetical protein AAA799D11_01826 [Marine Group I thaumarchaeote SCGC AAA799-D11]KFM20663.1 hypothetical protein SCCGRSA3_00119 [Marine Group I thaumarchaeote SCGC RSA3]